MDQADTAQSEASVLQAFQNIVSDEDRQEPQDSGQPEGTPDAPVEDGKAPVEAKEEQPEQEAAEDTETVEIDEESPMFDVVVGEGTKKLSLKELRAGYMMQQDYTRKTQEVAKQREEVQAQARQATEQAVKPYVERLQVFQKAVQATVAPELGNVDWNKLASEDPAEYVRLSNRAKQVNDVLTAAQQEINRVQSEQQHQEQTKLAEKAAKAVEVLQKDIPEWGSAVYQDLMKTAVEKYGYAPDEIAKETDPRLFKLLNDAKAQLAIREAKPVATKKVAVVPKTVKSNAREGDGQRRVVQDAKDRLRKSGRDSDALPIFERLLG